MRARGLKLILSHYLILILLSRPMRARGLKLYRTYLRTGRDTVAPHAGAWVETKLILDDVAE